MISVNSLTKMKNKIEAAKDNKSRAEGRLVGPLEELKSKFGSSDLKAARKKLSTLQKRSESLNQKFEEETEAVADEFSISN